MSRYAQVTFTDSVRQTQHEGGSGAAAARLLAEGSVPDSLGDTESRFIESRDGFYLASVSETGWPYVQFRGGPPGFVHVVDERTLAYADVRGNRQYITAGNVRVNDRVSLFFMDYPMGARLKVLGHAKTTSLDENADLTALVAEPRSDGLVERLMVVQVEAFAWNCSKHITPRYSEAELAYALQPLRTRLRELELENQSLRAQLEARSL